MHKYLLILFFSFIMPTLYAQKGGREEHRVFRLPKGVSSRDYVPGVIIVKFKATSGSVSKLMSVKPLMVESAGSLKKMFSEIEGAATTLKRKRDAVGLNRIYEVQVNQNTSIELAINEMLLNPEVEYAEPRYIHHTTLSPNDPLYPQQEHFSGIMAPQAWDLVGAMNAPSVIIAIVDSGSELTHPDLAANIYYNNREVINGQDDDGNGKVDDFRGWDFAGTNSTNEDNDPNIANGNNDHGVHVSGIASAVTNNGVGVATIAFNSAKLLIVKAGPDNSGTDITHGYEGIKYAADMGAQIINCSWGSTGGGSFGRDVVNYAIENGSIIVAAAGNSLNDIPEYPAAYNGVIAVANTTSSDTKASSSNFGSYISLTAPGNGILSTTAGGQYGPSSGTSMSAPMVSSAAALVRAYRPGLTTMKQVGEILRVTADNIDNENPQYQWQLGKGRLNVLKALTETPPAVRIKTITETEKRAANSVNPDTLYLYLDLENVLYPVNNLKLTLSSFNPNVSVISPIINIPSLGASAQTTVGPIKVLISPGSPSNLEVEFRVNYASGDNTYLDFEHFEVIIAEDYLNISTPSVSTTITSNGRIGYSLPEEQRGLGFLYKGKSLLFEGALMIGNSPSRVSNNARAASDETDEHFVSTLNAYEVENNADSVVAASEFDDRANPNRLNIAVKHRMIGYKKAPDDKYIIAEYEVFNTTNFELKNVHVGLFMDWDILGEEANATTYNHATRVAYVYDNAKPTAPYAAVKLLNDDAPPIYYPLSRQISGNPLSDDDFTLAEKWETLSGGVRALNLGTGNSIDVSYVTGNGPYIIPANNSIKVAFALIGGDNLQDIEQTAVAAQENYDLINTQGPKEPITKLEMQAYPNRIIASVDGSSTIQFDLPEAGQVSLELYNIAGQRVRSLIAHQTYGKGTHYYKADFSGGYLSEVSSGIYFYRLRYNNESKSEKIIIIK